MTLEAPVLVQIEGQWLALSGCGDVLALGAVYEDVLGHIFNHSYNSDYSS